MVSHVFVYGTLKRGQCREALWPRRPLAIRDVWTRGQLYRRSDYPAMIAGSDRVGGELWQFAADQIQPVLERLDQIEGTGQPGQPDLYQRVLTEVLSLSDQPLGTAWTYHYVTEPTRDGFERILAIDDQPVCWP